jgi:hypothetical protein
MVRGDGNLVIHQTAKRPFRVVFGFGPKTVIQVLKTNARRRDGFELIARRASQSLQKPGALPTVSRQWGKNGSDRGVALLFHANLTLCDALNQHREPARSHAQIDGDLPTAVVPPAESERDTNVGTRGEVTVSAVGVPCKCSKRSQY